MDRRPTKAGSALPAGSRSLLRGLRTAKDMTVAEAAERVGFSQSKLTKIELAQAVATRDDVVKMLDVYEETDP
jgi:transcriptional regulator with XRE-family HTH domain